MAAQQFFGLLLALVAVAVAYVGFKNRWPAVWAALSGGGAPAQDAGTVVPASSTANLSSGTPTLKYVAGMGKAGAIIQSSDGTVGTA